MALCGFCLVLLADECKKSLGKGKLTSRKVFGGTTRLSRSARVCRGFVSQSRSRQRLDVGILFWWEFFSPAGGDALVRELEGPSRARPEHPAGLAEHPGELGAAGGRQGHRRGRD